MHGSLKNNTGAVNTETRGGGGAAERGGEEKPLCRWRLLSCQRVEAEFKRGSEECIIIEPRHSFPSQPVPGVLLPLFSYSSYSSSPNERKRERRHRHFSPLIGLHHPKLAAHLQHNKPASVHLRPVEQRQGSSAVAVCGRAQGGGCTGSCQCQEEPEEAE
ncbi:unnamed protein product [Pleuronectes platessa]|uniref:Uncharacterized protein n=1 Tax=Pleuronectes platessa TaxID=8262 RepID=A0A9N7Y4L4_PLEPL|nr:unnamed protein product [Pleuronectes platessa]